MVFPSRPFVLIGIPRVAVAISGTFIRGPLAFLEGLRDQGKLVGRLTTPYREHLAQHFSVTYSRIGLPGIRTAVVVPHRRPDVRSTANPRIS